jgi:hypothetical protein
MDVHEDVLEAPRAPGSLFAMQLADGPASSVQPFRAPRERVPGERFLVGRRPGHTTRLIWRTTLAVDAAAAPEAVRR